MTLQQIEQKINNAKYLDFGTIFNNCIELFKKVWVQGLVVFILTVVCILPIYVIAYIPLLAFGLMDTYSDGSFSQEPNMLLLIFMVGILFFLIFFVMIIAFGLKAAFFRICMQKDLELMAKENYFYFLKKRYLGKIFKIVLATMGISIGASMLCFLPVFYVMVPLSLLNVVFAFNPDLSISDLISASFKLGNKKWGITFGLMIIAGILAQITGFIMCGVGVFVTASFSYLPLYFIYKEVLGFEGSSNGNDNDKVEFNYLED